MKYKISFPNYKVRDFTVETQITIPDKGGKTINFQELKKNDGKIMYRFIRANNGIFIPDPCEMSREVLYTIFNLINEQNVTKYF